jgi:hypothetical protein
MREAGSPRNCRGTCRVAGRPHPRPARWRKAQSSSSVPSQQRVGLGSDGLPQRSSAAPRGRRGTKRLAPLRASLEVEGIVDPARDGAGLVAQPVLLDVNDLVQLHVLAGALESRARLVRHEVLLGSGDGDDVDRHAPRADRRPALRDVVAPPIGMVVPLQHEVHPAALVHGLPMLAQQRVIAPHGHREHGVVVADDHPARPLPHQQFFEPATLQLGRARLVEGPHRVEHHEEHAGVPDEVDRLLVARRAIARQAELQRPVRREGIGLRAVRLGALDVFVVAGDGNGGNHAVQEAPRFEPLAPLVVVVTLAQVHQVAGMQQQRGARLLADARPDHPREVGPDGVLGIAEIEEREWPETGRRGAKLQPFAPGILAAHAVGVERVGLEALEAHRVMVRQAIGGDERPGRAGDGGSREMQPRRVAGHGDLRDRCRDAGSLCAS